MIGLALTNTEEGKTFYNWNLPKNYRLNDSFRNVSGAMFETGDLDIGSWEVLFVRKVLIFIFLLWNLLFSVIVTDTTIPSTQ